MTTEIFDLNDPRSNREAAITRCGEWIQKGETVVFPTETVYGLGANAFDETAVAKIFEAKGRPGDNPLIVHVASPDDVLSLVSLIPEKAKTLMEAYWPGPLTLIMPVSDRIPKMVTAGLKTVAVRCPSSITAHELIKIAGVPIAAPSANISGRPSPTRGQHVLEDMTGKVAAILISDEVEIGLESTVVDMTVDPPVMLRPGGITAFDLRKVIGEVVLSPNITENIIPEKVKSPGMKYKHYAPKGQVVIVRGKETERYNKINEAVSTLEVGTAIGILASDETAAVYEDLNCVVMSLGSREKPLTLGQNLFDQLRKCDALGLTHIFAEDIPATDETLAVINRLYKSAGYRFL